MVLLTVGKIFDMKALLSFQLVPIALALISEKVSNYSSIVIILLTACAFVLSGYFLVKLSNQTYTIGLFSILFYWLTTGAGIVYLLNPLWLESFKVNLMAVGLIVLLAKLLLQLKYFETIPFLKPIKDESAYKEFIWFHFGFLIFFMT